MKITRPLPPLLPALPLLLPHTRHWQRVESVVMIAPVRSPPPLLRMSPPLLPLLEWLEDHELPALAALPLPWRR